nr:mechanosensitive ion channel family protein [Streptomyces albus]
MLSWFLADATPPATPTLREAQENATQAAGWVEENWSVWLGAGLRILLIIVIAFALRSVVRRTITKFIARMNRASQATEGLPLRGLLVNAERRRQRSEAIGSVLRSVTSFVILGTAALTVLSVLSINLAPLLASAGVAGIALGFGARNLVTDFLSGVFMILEDQYGVGDVVDAGVASGEVIEVGLRVTKLRGDEGEIWYVRNGEIKRIGNKSQGWATASVDIHLRPDEDLEKARRTIAEAGERMAAEEPWNERLWGPVEVLGLEAMTLESVVIRTSARTMPGKRLGVERELRWRIKQAFDGAGIRIVGAEPEPAVEAARPDPLAGVAPPSALASSTSPQSVSASPLPQNPASPPSPASGPNVPNLSK